MSHRWDALVSGPDDNSSLLAHCTAVIPEMFLSQDGLPVDSHITSSSRHDQGASINTHAKHQGAVSMKSAVLRWSATQGSAIAGSAFQLGPLDVDFEPGLNLVCGGIGSGKSLLLLGKCSACTAQNASDLRTVPVVRPTWRDSSCHGHCQHSIFSS